VVSVPAAAASVPASTGGCRSCCCHHQQQHHHQQPATAVQLTSQRGGISLRVARVASTTSVRAAPYAHSQHQGLGTECRCREETGAVGGGGAHILGGPMLFVPFTVPSFPATHQQQTSHPPPQLSQLNHLNHQGGLVQPPTSNQATIHSTSCSPQQQATTPNKISICNNKKAFKEYQPYPRNRITVSQQHPRNPLPKPTTPSRRIKTAQRVP
ncbi:hypothetical protein TSAR_006368, partial [Trichomalopsis sarcophagae]